MKIEIIYTVNPDDGYDRMVADAREQIAQVFGIPSEIIRDAAERKYAWTAWDARETSKY